MTALGTTTGTTVDRFKTLPTLRPTLNIILPAYIVNKIYYKGFLSLPFLPAYIVNKIYYNGSLSLPYPIVAFSLYQR